MNWRAFADDAAASAIDLEWLAAAIAPSSAPGMRLARNRRPFAPGSESAAQAEVDAVAAAAQTLEPATTSALRSTLARCPDPLVLTQRASAGDVLDDVDFYELVRFCDAVSALRAHADLPAAVVPAPCAELSAALAPGRRRGGAFYLDDAFDSGLRDARVLATEREAGYEAARGRLVAQVAHALERDDLRESEFIVMRDRAPGGLPEHVRVVREAPAYFLCEIDLDEGALDALERRDAALAAAAAAEDRTRASLSGVVREHAESLAAVAGQVGELDLFVARVAFAQRYACVAPAIVHESQVAFEDARFLPLQASLDRRARGYTPLSLQLDGVAVITGPNMGGKTAALATCGFIAACAAWGVPVPARAARVALFDRVVWLASASEDPHHDALLSAFGSEVVGLRNLFEFDLGHSLVLVDEFARTTNPLEGRALSVALAQTLRRRGAIALLASHLAGLAERAGATHFAVAGLRERLEQVPTRDLARALEAIGSAMDYRIVRVGADGHVPADAIALAGLLGVGDDFIAAAKAALSKGGET